MKPARNILDKSFAYVPACATDIRLTFERIRREMAKQAAPVTPIKRERKHVG